TEVVIRFDPLSEVAPGGWAAGGGRRGGPGARNNGLVVEISDNGCGRGRRSGGGDAEPGRRSLGLVPMRERAQRWGGRVAAGPRPTGGWTVAVTLPHLRTRVTGSGEDPEANAGERPAQDGSESGR